MLNSRAALIDALNSYQTSFSEEMLSVSAFFELLKSDRCYFRDHLPGHITGSAWIINKEQTHVLLVQHAKLKKWLQPGGHADGYENIIQVATKEVEEETGLTNLPLLKPGLFDIDIHPIPARKDFPEHLHYDIRFAFLSNGTDPIRVSDESHDLQWVDLNLVPDLVQNNSSILRMIRKTIGN